MKLKRHIQISCQTGFCFADLGSGIHRKAKIHSAHRRRNHSITNRHHIAQVRMSIEKAASSISIHKGDNKSQNFGSIFEGIAPRNKIPCRIKEKKGRSSFVFG
jgi:hypothetical protein